MMSSMNWRSKRKMRYSTLCTYWPEFWRKSTTFLPTTRSSNNSLSIDSKITNSLFSCLPTSCHYFWQRRASRLLNWIRLGNLFLLRRMKFISNTYYKNGSKILRSQFKIPLRGGGALFRGSEWPLIIIKSIFKSSNQFLKGRGGEQHFFFLFGESFLHFLFFWNFKFSSKKKKWRRRKMSLVQSYAF